MPPWSAIPVRCDVFLDARPETCVQRKVSSRRGAKVVGRMEALRGDSDAQNSSWCWER